MERKPKIRHEIKITPQYNSGYGIYGFITKVVIPIWNVRKRPSGTVERSPGWMPAMIHGSKPSELISRLESMVQGYIKQGIYRPTDKR